MNKSNSNSNKYKINTVTNIKIIIIKIYYHNYFRRLLYFFHYD